jgi:hypothetical protein
MSCGPIKRRECNGAYAKQARIDVAQAFSLAA